MNARSVLPVVLLREGRLSLADLRAPGSERVVCATPGVERPLCAVRDLAVCEYQRTDGGVTERGLVAIELDYGHERARIPLTRPVRRAWLSPDAAMVAAVYNDGGVEVFSLAP